MCSDRHQLCCPPGHYGKKCKACPGGPGSVCSGHGTCVGDGLRSGTGRCKCNVTRNGTACADCADFYYAAQDGSCLPCHVGCKTSCTGPEGTDCDACKGGFALSEITGCVDEDECATGSAGCAEGSSCVNRLGSFDCVTCHAHCDQTKGCRGAAASDCEACAPGYERQSDICDDVDECTAWACASAETCRNTAGSFICTCILPAQTTTDGTCQLPEHLAAEDWRTPSETAPLPVEASSKDQGVAEVGASEAVIKEYAVTFTSLMNVIPEIELVGKNVCCGDGFALRATQISSQGFTLVVARTDSQSGWNQLLKVQWRAVVPQDSDQENRQQGTAFKEEL